MRKFMPFVLFALAVFAGRPFEVEKENGRFLEEDRLRRFQDLPLMARSSFQV